jgi:DNA modification methylase
MPLVGEMYRTERATLVQGDCLDVLRCLEDGEVDALVTDPPAAISFMQRKWDSFKSRDVFVDFLTLRLAECRRVCRPGAVGLVWALPRTSHWTALAIEEAGWVIEDRIAHMFGCLSDDTEILTEDGWEPYHKIEKGSIALTYDIGNDTFCWEPIQEVFTYDYCDTAYRIYSDHTDQLVSRNHCCIVEQGGAYAFAYAETLAREQKVCIPVLEDMRGLLEALPVRKLLTGETQQNVLAGVLWRDDLYEDSRYSSGQKGKICSPCMSTMWQREGGACKASGDEQRDLLQPFLQIQGVCSSSATVLCQHERESTQGQAIWSKEPSVEGGSNILQDAWEICRGKVRSLSDQLSTDGKEGRLCDGTSVAGGQDFGTPVVEERGCSPQRPQPQEQCNLQSDVVCLESRPQTVRASGFTRADLARVEPVHYRGIVWCVRVPSGAFIARRNGKVFVTGNSGFPKSKHRLKPACEDWWLCRNPGPLWLGVEDCRIGSDSTLRNTTGARDGISLNCAVDGSLGKPMVTGSSSGRYPANLVLSHHPECVCQRTKKVKGTHRVCARGKGNKGKLYPHDNNVYDKFSEHAPHDYTNDDGTETVENWTCHPDCPIRLLDEQAGERRSYCSNQTTAEAASGKEFVNKNRAVYELSKSNGKSFVRGRMYADKGGASRFFANFPAEGDTSRMLYCSKASKKDRGEGNVHPTVKSTTLMSWLVKLACPEGGLVLDPFAGSGSTGVACLRTGRRFLGVESDRESCLTATRRLQGEE